MVAETNIHSLRTPDRGAKDYLFFLFVTILAQSFLSFVRSYFMSFTLFSTWHNILFLEFKNYFIELRHFSEALSARSEFDVSR